MTAPPLQHAHPRPHVSAAAKADSQALRSRLAALAAHLLVAVIALVGIGGATRVMEAGLACPDWPLCYGSLLPGRQMNLQVFLEWFHRLDAFVVGVGLLVLATASVWWRRQLPVWQPPLALGCLVLVGVQGGLGALTVLQLLPAGVVTAHLLTALLLVALLSGCHQALNGEAVEPSEPSGPTGAVVVSVGLPLLALMLVLAQCLLGGLMASQWAAGRCVSTGDACGWLLAHRLGARSAGLGSLALAAWLGWRRPDDRPFAGLVAALVVIQIALGVLILRLGLAVPAVTVAHQITAALLVAVLAALAVRSWRFPHPSFLSSRHG